MTKEGSIFSIVATVPVFAYVTLLDLRCKKMVKERKTKKVSKEEALKIITDPTAAETGLFWCFSGVAFVGIDNTTHEAWTEDFRTRRELFDWLLSRGKRSEMRKPS